MSPASDNHSTSDEQNPCQRQSEATIVSPSVGRRLHPARRSLPSRSPRYSSGRYLRQARSPCARSTAGRLSPRSSLLNALTLQRDTVTSSRRRCRQAEFPHHSRHHLLIDRKFSILSRVMRIRCPGQIGLDGLRAPDLVRLRSVAVWIGARYGNHSRPANEHSPTQTLFPLAVP